MRDLLRTLIWPLPLYLTPDLIVQGVEIQTYIFDGQGEHFDTSIDQWVPLPAGGLQVLRTGSGMSHAERIGAGTRVFQIWLEPDMTKTITQPASYDVHLPSDFITTTLADPPGAGLQETEIVGGRGPVRTEVPGLKVVRLRASGSAVKAASFVVGGGHIGMMYVLEGTVAVPASDEEAAAGEPLLERDDALILHGGDREVLLDLSGDADIFLLTVPRRPSYQLEAERKS